MYASKSLNKLTIGIQHGAYSETHEAYCMNHLSSHIWYDYLIVWGPYFKELFSKYNKIFPSSNLICASNKLNIEYKGLIGKPRLKTILIPYEFLCDSIEVGKYITAFIKFGYQIIFKLRPDAPLDEQIEPYLLEKSIQDTILFTANLSPDLAAKVDLVCGTSTTYLYDLLPLQRPIWILNTSHELRSEMLHAGIAESFTFSDFNNIWEKYVLSYSNTSSRRSDIFGKQSISSVISNVVRQS